MAAEKKGVGRQNAFKTVSSWLVGAVDQVQEWRRKTPGVLVSRSATGND